MSRNEQLINVRVDHYQSNITNHYQSNVIKVEPAGLIERQPPEQINQINLLYMSQTSQSGQSESQRTHKLEPQTNHTKIVFQIEQPDQPQSPQSSLRKLYKHQKAVEPIQTYQESPPERMLRQQIDSKEYDEYQQDQNSDDNDIQFDEFSKKKQLRSNNIFDLIIYPIPKTKMLRCLVIITKNNFFSLESIFDLYLVQQKRHLLRARKKRFRIASSFQIFGKENQEIDKIGAIKSNFSRTQYKLIKSQKQRELLEPQPSQSFSSDIIKITSSEKHQSIIVKEQQCCYIAYESNLLGLSQQRLMLIKPKKSIPKTERFSDLNAAYQNCQYERIEKFSTRIAEKGIDGKLILDFKQKNIIDSSRNMIIQNQYGEVGLIFAKFSEEIYLLNVMNPFNLLEGFFLGLCNLDRKIFVS